MCSDLDKLPCVQNDRTKSTRCAPVPWMGAFQGERHINLHVSPTTSSFCPISLAMILIFSKNPKTPKIAQFGALAGQIQHMAAQIVGFTPRPIRYGSRNWQEFYCTYMYSPPPEKTFILQQPPPLELFILQ